MNAVTAGIELKGNPHAGNPYVRFADAKCASAAMQKRGSLLRGKLIRTIAFISLLWISVCPSLAATAEAKSFDNAISISVKKGHPRLFAGADGFAAIKSGAKKGSLRELALKRVIERADILLETQPLERKMTGRRLLPVSREALYRISTLSMAYRVTGERRYFERALRELKAVCAFSDWNPGHFLDTGEMSLAVGIGYDWLYDGLSDDERREIRAAFARNGLAAGKKGGGWTRAASNWGQVSRAGMIAAALSLADDPALRADCTKMLKESVEALPIAMKVMAPDGCYPEGPVYWHYGVSFNVFAIAMLESACGTDFGLSDLPGFWKTAEYPNLVTGPTGLTIGYSDCGWVERCPMQSLWWFARKLNRPDVVSEKEILEWNNPTPKDYVGWLPPVELLWIDERKLETVPVSSPLVWFGRGVVPIVTFRTGWGKDDAFIGLKGGSPSAWHGHMDGGNFVLDMAGIRWVWELQYEDYQRIEQMKTVSLWNFSQKSSRWSLLRLNTFGHNVPRINGAQQCVKGSAKFVNVVDKPSPSATIDLTSLYPAASNVTRIATLAGNGRSFEVSDTFAGLEPGVEVIWQFILKAKSSAQGGSLMLADGGHELSVAREGTEATDWSVVPAEGPKPLNSPNPGFSVASFRVRVGTDGKASAKVSFSLVR